MNEQMLSAKRPSHYIQRLSLQVGVQPSGDVAIYLYDDWDVRLSTPLKDLFDDAIDMLACPEIAADMRKELARAVPALRCLVGRIEDVLEQQVATPVNAASPDVRNVCPC